MAWTAATRGDYVRPSGTYASDVTDREWALIAPLLPAAKPGGRPRTTCLRIPQHPIADSDDIRSPIPEHPITVACRR